ncbi:MAG: hypothetical protein WC444_06265 [Candidatus Paceibacterota bacterium]
MKKLILTAIMFGLLTSGAYAQDTKPQPKPKSTEELTWQAQALQNEYLYLQERLKNIQFEFNKIKAELDARKVPMVDTSKPDSKEDKKGKK